MSTSEVVLLVEPLGGNLNGCLRAHELTGRVEKIIIEQPRGAAPRTWIWHGERALTGERIFREHNPVTPTEEKEHPLFDETDLKEPLKFGVNGATFSKLAKKYGKK